jgi:hypothetical protein
VEAEWVRLSSMMRYEVCGVVNRSKCDLKGDREDGVEDRSDGGGDGRRHGGAKSKTVCM